MTSIVQDLRDAARSLKNTPGFTTVAVVTLALGIGANVAIFAVTSGVLFKGSPSVDHSDSIVYIGSGGACCVSYPDLEDWRAQVMSFEGMGAVADLRITLSDMHGVAEASNATQVTANTFALIGQRPLVGRDFLAADEAPGAAPVAILSHAFWEQRYGKDPGIIGQALRINDVATTVIGVMPEGMSFPQRQDLWVPLVPTPELRQRNARQLWFAFGRLARGATIEHARVEMDVIGRRLAKDHPDTNQNALPVLMRFHEFYIGPRAATIYAALWGAVGFVLLIACANVANLLLARASGRTREVSVRLALGATRWRIVRQLMVESLMLSALGGFLAWWLARAGVRVYELVANPPTLSWAYQLFDFSFDERVLGYLVAVSIGASLLLGTTPALHLSTLDVNTSLKKGDRGNTGGASRQLARVVVAGEVAVAIILLAGAGVMLRSFLNVYTANTGATTANVVTMLVTLPEARYAAPESRIVFFDRLTTRLKTIPGVDSVAIAWRPPTSGSMRMPYVLDGAPALNEQRRPVASTLPVGPEYFDTLGVRVLAGRDFTVFDGTSSMPVAIVNERFASTQWPRDNAIGKRLRLYDAEAPDDWITVVGVVSNVVQNSTRQTIEPIVYLPYRQRPSAGMWVFARARVTPDSLGPAFRHELQAIDSALPIWLGPFSLDERLSAFYWNRGVYSALFLLFSAMALLLASVGLYAVVAHSVGQRRQEIGIRMAMGATVRDVLTLVFSEGMKPVGAGLIVGLAGSLALNRLLRAELVSVSPGDPIALLAASAALVAAAALGCYLPARRAARVDPLVALRYE